MTTRQLSTQPGDPMLGSGSRRHPARNLNGALVWLAVAVPFVVTVLAGGPAGGLLPHGTYHLLYAAIVGAAVYVLLKWRSLSTKTSARLLMLVIAVLQGLAIVGHLGEWASTLFDDRYEEAGTGLVKGDEALHTAFASVTVPALALSILLLIATTLVAARRGRDRRRVPPHPS
jgi:hypothetical protein